MEACKALYHLLPSPTACLLFLCDSSSVPFSLALSVSAPPNLSPFLKHHRYTLPVGILYFSILLICYLPDTSWYAPSLPLVSLFNGLLNEAFSDHSMGNSDLPICLSTSQPSPQFIHLHRTHSSALHLHGFLPRPGILFHILPLKGSFQIT